VNALDDLSPKDAVGIVAASVRRLFSVISEQQARDLASLVLDDLRAQGVRLVQDTGLSATAVQRHNGDGQPIADRYSVD